MAVFVIWKEGEECRSHLKTLASSLRAWKCMPVCQQSNHGSDVMVVLTVEKISLL